jgi:hypothetical protein
MPLFELASALSPELKAAHQLADRLSETTGIKNLAETADTAEALAKIIVGVSDDPLDGEAYTLPELEVRHFFAHVYAEREDGFVAGQSPEAVGVPRQGGAFRVYLCRQVRESEDKTDAYNFFWDRVSSVGADVVTASEELAALTNRNRFKQVNRRLGPDFGPRRAQGDRGDYLEALLIFIWGDVQTD